MKKAEAGTGADGRLHFTFHEFGSQMRSKNGINSMNWSVGCVGCSVLLVRMIANCVMVQHSPADHFVMVRSHWPRERSTRR